jgi:hypothetical protein
MILRESQIRLIVVILDLQRKKGFTLLCGIYNPYMLYPFDVLNQDDQTMILQMSANFRLNLN